jgi:hypothetical protein
MPIAGTIIQNSSKKSNASELPSRFEVLWVKRFKVKPIVKTTRLTIKKINEDL